MKREIDWESLLDYFEKNSEPEDTRRTIEGLVSENDGEYFNLMQKIWNTPEDCLRNPDLEQAWMNIKQKTGFVENTHQDTTHINSKRNRAVSFGQLFRSRIIKIAAVILFIIVSYIAIFLNEPLQMETIHAGYAQQEKIMLEDGSLIHLDAGSIFRYPNQFSSDERKVFLNGEGYLEVTPDPNRPFIVHTDIALVEVIGTKFNIRSWRESNQVIVAVLDGSVTLSRKGSNRSDGEVMISRDQVSTLRANGNPSPPQNADVQSYLSWQKREMYFQSATTREVLDQLERWYDLEFELPGGFNASNRVTIFIDNKPIEEILDVIALMNNFQYYQKGKKVIFSEKKIL